MSQRWLVTGAAGFIGSNLCEYLLRAGDTVKGLDNFAAGKRENVARIQSLEREFEFVEADIRNRDMMIAAAHGADVVVHLAAQGSVQKSFADVHYNDSVNVGGFLNVLTAAGEVGVRTFIYASSCAVYGENSNLPLSERETPAPLSPYAVSKLCNDLYAESLRGRFPNMRLFGLRFFNIFGPWQDPYGDYAAVIPRWINAMLSGDGGIIFGDGSATRDFCHVENVCRLVAGLGADRRASGGVYNIGTGKATSLEILYRSIMDVLERRRIGSRPKEPEYRPWRAGDIVHSRADIALASRELAFAPAIDLIDGIGKILTEQYRL